MISADLAGKAVLVTGAASGIGLAAAELFSRCGATVALNHLPDDRRGPDQVARLKAEGRRVVAAPGDVSRPGEAERMVTGAIDALGRLDFLVNNAGTPNTPAPIPFSDLDALTEEFWSKILTTNLIGPFRCAHAAVTGAEGGAWRDLQHRLDRRRPGVGQQHPLCDEQGGADQSDALAGAHPGARDPGQRRRAGLCRQPVEQGLAARPQRGLDRAHTIEARLQARGHRRDDLLPVRRRRDDHRPDDHRRRRPHPLKERISDGVTNQHIAHLMPSFPRKRESRVAGIGCCHSGPPLSRG